MHLWDKTNNFLIHNGLFTQNYNMHHIWTAATSVCLGSNIPITKVLIIYINNINLVTLQW